MPLSYQLVTPPAVEPVSLALAKQQCRVDFTEEDALIELYISGARELVEKRTGRAIYNQTWKRTLDHFPLWWSADGTVNPSYRSDWPYYSDFWNRITIDLPMPRCVSVTSITYQAVDGTLTTLDPSQYVVDVTSEPARIVPAANTFWPSAMTYVPGSVVITFVAGSYGDGTVTDTCPAAVKQAILLCVGHWYKNRELAGETMGEIPQGFEALIQTEKVESLIYRPV